MIYPIPGTTAVSDAFNVQGIVLADRSATNYDTSNAYYMAWLGPQCPIFSPASRRCSVKAGSL
jgi:hypothetical protein